jgi:hypothetical protein
MLDKPQRYHYHIYVTATFTLSSNVLLKRNFIFLKTQKHSSKQSNSNIEIENVKIPTISASWQSLFICPTQ